jgi:transposase
MVGERKSLRMREQVLALHAQGKGKKRIALILGISKNTVKGIIRASPNQETRSGERGDVSPRAESVLDPDDWRRLVTWDEVLSQLSLRYVSVKCLHQEYGPPGVSYWSFWRELKARTPQDLVSRARIRLQHKPGSRVEIDYCDGIAIVDRRTGECTSTDLFCGVSSFSDYTFGEFVLSQKKEEFIAVQDRMNAFFGGVFEYLVVDNLKSGVHRSHTYDPDVNPLYMDYANYHGFAVLPARPRTPRDKPAVEAGIGVIQRQFFAEVRNKVFYSLAELNAAFRTYLSRLNSDVMKDYGVTRAQRFAEEQGLLRPLKSEPFEIAEYRTAKVHPDCHVQVDKNFYSVPYPLIGQELRVRLTPRLVEVFNSDHQSVAIHSRCRGYGKFSTETAHYPAQKVAAARFDVILARKEAKNIGPQTEKLVESLLEGTHPLRYLRRTQGILRLKNKFTTEAIEYGCHQAMLFARPRLQYITDCAKKFQTSGPKLRILSAPERDLSSVYLQNKPINLEI